jgi:hypothetical protein
MDGSSGRNEGDLAFDGIGHCVLQSFLDICVVEGLEAGCRQVCLQQLGILLPDLLLFFLRNCGVPSEKIVASDEDSSTQIRHVVGKRFAFQMPVNVYPGVGPQSADQGLESLPASECVEEDVEAVLLDSCLVLLLPVALGDDDVLGPFLLEQLGLLLPPHDVEEGDAEGLTVLVEHPSESGGCSSVDNSLFAFSVPENLGHSDDCQGVDDSRGSRGQADVLIDLEC